MSTLLHRISLTTAFESNEVLLRIPINSVHDQYVANFNKMKSYIAAATSASKTTAGVDTARERVATRQRPDPDE